MKEYITSFQQCNGSIVFQTGVSGIRPMSIPGFRCSCQPVEETLGFTYCSNLLILSNNSLQGKFSFPLISGSLMGDAERQDLRPPDLLIKISDVVLHGD